MSGPMREGESELVGAVRERMLDGDRAGMIAAAVRLWATPAARPDEPDAAHAEVWGVLATQGATADAVSAALEAIRAGARLRPAAFIDVTEHVQPRDPSVTPPPELEPDAAQILLGLAQHVLDAAWPAYPYLATVFDRLVEGKQEPALWTFIQRNATALGASTERWTVVGFVLCTSRIGKRQDLAAWFEGWHARPAVPTWVLAAYAATVLQQASSMAKLPRPTQLLLFRLAHAALATAVPDTSTPFFRVLVMLDHLSAGALEPFILDMGAHAAELAAAAAALPVEHPVVAYANGVKRSHPVRATDFAWEQPDTSIGLMMLVPAAGMASLAAQGKNRPSNFRITLLLAELRVVLRATSRVFALLVEMHETAHGSPRAIELFRLLEKARPSSLPWIVPSWKRLVKERLSWRTRLKLYFA